MIDTPPSEATAADEDAVRTMMDKLAQAWAAGDATSYASLFTADADYTTFDGTVMRGREQIAAGHAPLFAGIMRGSRLVEQITVARFPYPDCAIVTSRGGIVTSWQRRRTTPSRKRVSALTIVALRRDNRWQITAFQNTRYRPWNSTTLGRLMTVMNGRRLNRNVTEPPDHAPDGSRPEPGAQAPEWPTTDR